MTNRQLARTRKSSARKSAARPKPPLTNKQLAIQAIRDAPDEATWEEIVERIEIMARIRAGMEAADAGDVISHEEFKRQVTRCLSK